MVQKTQGPCSFKKNIEAEEQFKLQEELKVSQDCRACAVTKAQTPLILPFSAGAGLSTDISQDWKLWPASPSSQKSPREEDAPVDI